MVFLNLQLENRRYFSLVLYIQISIDHDDFIIPCDKVGTIIPNVKIQYLPGAADFMAGIVNYHGNTVPVIDITMLLKKRTSKNFLSTRIILLNNDEMLPNSSVCGILAENVTEVVKLNTQFDNDSMQIKPIYSMYVDAVFNHKNTVLQKLNMDVVLAQGFGQHYFELI